MLPPPPSIHQECENAKSHLGQAGATFLRIKLDHACQEPLRQQIYQSLRRAIVDRKLLPGSKLPSTRSLARRLKVSRNTVLSVYEELSAEGLVAGRTGSATRVCHRFVEAVPFPVPNVPDLRTLLIEAQYPNAPIAFQDLDGHPHYIHR
jgi:DNA-binding transcriptional MocR family regulator